MAALRRNKKKIGKIGYWEYRASDRDDWGRLWRVTYRGAKFKIDQITHSEEEAREVAREANLKREKVETGYDTQLTQAQEEEYKKAQSQIEIFNAKQAEAGGKHREQLDLSKAVQFAIEVQTQADSINTSKEKAGGLIYKATDVIHEGARLIKRKEFRTVRPRYGVMIDAFLKEKLGRHGNKHTGGKLEEGSKYEWSQSLGILKQVAGNLELVEGKEANQLIEKLTVAIHDSKLSDGGEKAPRTKKGYASKIKQFGNWLETNDHIRKNPFDKLVAKFKFKRDSKKKLVTNEEVTQLFATALTDKKCHVLIPYLSMYFFSSLRPFEIADPEGYKNRNLQWHKLLFDSPWKEIKDTIHVDVVAFEKVKEGRRTVTKRMSKLSQSRQGIVFPNGVAWLKYFVHHFGEPEKINITVKKMIRLKKLAGVTWAKAEADWGRHTIASCACKFYTFDGVIDFLCRRFGHDYDTQQEYYEKPVTDARAEGYLTITPASVIEFIGNNPKTYPQGLYKNS